MVEGLPLGLEEGTGCGMTSQCVFFNNADAETGAGRLREGRDPRDMHEVVNRFGLSR